MKENENEIVIQFANTIKSLLMSLWYPNQIKTNQNKSSLFLKNTKVKMTLIK
jgi:uncharacterized membrane protein